MKCNGIFQIALLILIGMASCTGTGTGTGDGNTPEPPSGIYSLTGGEVAVTSLLQNESVIGISIRTSWESIELRQGVFDWVSIDETLNRVRSAGKKASITVIPGVNAPNWVYTNGAQKFTFIDNNPFSLHYQEEMFSPMPWDNVFLQAWKNFIREFAARYNSDDSVTWIRITGPMNTLSGDWNLQSEAEWAKYVGTENEFSNSRLIAAIEEVIDTFALSFPSKPLSLAIGKTKIVDPPPALDVAIEITNYGYSRYGNRFLVQENGWDATVSPTDEAGLGTGILLQHAPYAGAQMVWSATNDPYCRMNGGVTPCDPRSSLDTAVTRAIEHNLSFLEVYADDVVNPDLQDILRRF